MQRIAVIGASKCNQEIYQLAYTVGQEIASHGCALYCGGLSGVMEAAAKGAKSKFGMTIGILPSLDANDADPYIDYPICTGISHARNLCVVASVDAVIAVGGEYGTLSEIAFALELNKPIFRLKSWDLGDQLTNHAASPEQAVELALAAIKQSRSRAEGPDK